MTASLMATATDTVRVWQFLDVDLPCKEVLARVLQTGHYSCHQAKGRGPAAFSPALLLGDDALYSESPYCDMPEYSEWLKAAKAKREKGLEGPEQGNWL